MSDNFVNVLEQVQSLSRHEQLELISSLAQMLNEKDETIPQYVMEENRRRLSNYDAGLTQAIPYKEAMLSVREQIRKWR